MLFRETTSCFRKQKSDSEERAKKFGAKFAEIRNMAVKQRDKIKEQDEIIKKLEGNEAQRQAAAASSAAGFSGRSPKTA